MSLGRIALYLVALVVAAALLILGVLVYQGRQAPRTNAPYVALGSSFAAGLGLGARSPGSPFVCQRSVNGYPQQLARMTGLTLVDMSCSGATAAHVLRGGQVFLGPQIDAIGPDTQLVTITAGGNDVGYVGDLTAMAFRNRGGVMGFLTGRFWKGARPVADRPFNQLQDDMIACLREIRRRAPKAQIMVMNLSRHPARRRQLSAARHRYGAGSTDAACRRSTGPSDTGCGQGGGCDPHRRGCFVAWA
ncbi:MAG TPA: SGNH/GDSL hydrolase family protein [Sphingobium sp.]